MSVRDDAIILDELRSRVYQDLGRITLRMPIGVNIEACSVAEPVVGQGSLFDPPPASSGSGYEWPLGSRQCRTVEQMIACCPGGRTGDRVPVTGLDRYNKDAPLPPAQIMAVSIGRLEEISDEEIRAEGYANWTEYAFHWNQRYPKAPWDLNPLCWIVQVVVG